MSGNGALSDTMGVPKPLGAGRAALMRGQGSVVGGDTPREAVFNAAYLEAAAKLQMQALGLGEIKYSGSPGDGGGRSPSTAWENWRRQVGREMQPEQ
jgi:ribulose-5-phosphate 4-epimerase/fuculose-1-phosphate aldolase